MWRASERPLRICGTEGSNPRPSSGEYTANLPRTAVGAVMFLAGEEAWPIDIIASELSSARPSGDLAKTAFRSQGARGAFLGSAVPLRRPARRHGRAPPLYRRKGKAPRPRRSLRDGGRGSCRESARQTASAPTARQALIAPENSFRLARAPSIPQRAENGSLQRVF